MPAPDSGSRVEKLVALRADSATCFLCALAQGRTRTVFGTGNVEQPPVAFVGEAPGANEDEAGVPFVGRAGKLLDEFIQWMGYKREHVYILNPVLCRPPKNRQPAPEELAACRPNFEGQLAIIKPRTIVALGRTAATALLGESAGTLGSLRNTWHRTPLGLVRVTYHPAYVLRTPAARTLVHEDLTAVRQAIDMSG